jgi:isochorismate synthase
MIDFIKSKNNKNPKTCLLYLQSQIILKWLVFSENDHLYFAENFEEWFCFCSFVGSQMILIPFEQSVKWSALITLVKKLLILHLLN